MRLPPPTTLTRSALLQIATLLPASILLPASATEGNRADRGAGAGYAQQPALEGKGYGKSEMDYSDFDRTPTGLLFKNAKPGDGGDTPQKGDRVVVEWTGYTIGYFGRPFETKQLRALDKIEDPDLRFVIGSGAVIPGLEEGVAGMTKGAVRQLVIKPQIGYPADDPGHDRVGPKPSTFSGKQALNFVLQNKELIDKTLLFNVKLVRIDKGGASGEGVKVGGKQDFDFSSVKFKNGGDGGVKF